MGIFFGRGFPVFFGEGFPGGNCPGKIIWMGIFRVGVFLVPRFTISNIDTSCLNKDKLDINRQDT